MGKCQVEGCDKPHAARGYCHTHYRQARYRGLNKVQEHSEKGGGSVHKKGYSSFGHKHTHTIRVEQALGKPLPNGAVVHHVHGDKDNPDAELVICPNQEYHALLHRRTDALDACGNPNARKCRYCGEWDDPIQGNMYISSGSTHHRECRNAIERQGRIHNE